MPNPSICIALHDVAAATWRRCEFLLACVEAVAPSAPVTLLVVPRWHGRDVPKDEEANFIARLRDRAARGDELALHGWQHLDDAPVVRSNRDPRSWASSAVDRLKRRVYTASEGEFFAIDREEASRRMRLGLDWADRAQLDMQGFVAPAWMLGAGAWEALDESPFVYTTTLKQLHVLHPRMAIDAPCITASARSGWRRAASRAWLATYPKLLSSLPLIRLGLHPADAGDPQLVRSWQRVIESAIDGREPLTKIEAVKRYTPNVAPVATTPEATPAPITTPAITSLG